MDGDGAGGGRRRRSMSDRTFSRLLIAPAMVLLLLLALYPLGYVIRLAIHESDLSRSQDIGGFVGLDNFRAALEDDVFWRSARLTVIFTILAVGIQMTFGMALGLLLNRLTWLKGPIRALILLPLATAPVATGLIWRYMYNRDFGVFNQFTEILGLGTPNWLGSETLAILSILAFDTWMWTPFVAVVVLAGLQALPKAPFEAAQLDRASSWQVFRRLTLPMLKPLLIFVLLLRTIDALRLYDPIYAITQGGPGTATETLSFHLYRVGLRFFEMDRASVIALLFLFVAIVISGFVLRPLTRAQSARARQV